MKIIQKNFFKEITTREYILSTTISMMLTFESKDSKKIEDERIEDNIVG